MDNKENKKSAFSLNPRDKFIVFIVAGVAVIALAFFFGFSKINESKKNVDSQVTKQEALNRDLKEKNANKQQYLTETETYKNRFNAAIAGYEQGTSQDHQLMFLRQVELTTGPWIKSVTFAASSPIYQFGAITSSNPGAAGTKAYKTDMQGYKSTNTVAYECTYDNFKKVLAYLNNYYSKNTIDNLTATYSAEEDKVSGTITLSSYCITGSDRKFTKPNYSAIAKGTANIFKSEAFTPFFVAMENALNSDTEGNYILGDYDYYMLANASTSDINSLVIGRKDDADGSTMVQSSKNSVEKVNIKVWGSAGNYKISYECGTKQYPATNFSAGAKCVPGETIDFLILSSARLSADDKSGAEISIDNQTDLNMNVKVTNDDATNPRINIKSNTGNVTIYK